MLKTQIRNVKAFSDFFFFQRSTTPMHKEFAQKLCPHTQILKIHNSLLMCENHFC